MANGIVNLIFRTIKKGSGFEDVAKDTAKAKEGMSDMGRAAQTLGTVLGNTGGIAGRMVRTFLTGGAWELAAEGVKFLVAKWTEYREKAKQAAIDAAKAFGESMSHAADVIGKKLKQVMDGIRAMASLSKSLLGYRKAGDSADTSAAIAGVNAKEREALANAANDSERAVISANAALERAKIKATESTRAATADLAEADSDVVRAQKRVAAAEERVSASASAFAKAQAHMQKVLGRSEDNEEVVAEADKTLAAAQNALADANAELAKARDDAKLAEVAHMTEKEKARKVEADAAEQVAAAEFALAETRRKQKEAAEKEAAKRAEEAARIEAEIEAEEAETEAREALAETYQNLAEQAKEKGREQVRQMQRLNASIFRVQRRYDDALRGIGRTRRGQAADAAHTNGLFGPYQYGGRSNGGENFIDWDRASRFAGWGDRDAQKAARRDSAAQKRYDRIRDALENGETVSKADEAFFGKFKAYQDQKGGAEKLKNALEAAQKKRDQLQEEMKKTLESIDKNIKDALAVG